MNLEVHQFHSEVTHPNSIDGQARNVQSGGVRGACARACGQVVGAAAMLGGVTRMTLSITVLTMEGTAALQLIVPLMLAVFIAKACTAPSCSLIWQPDHPLTAPASPAQASVLKVPLMCSCLAPGDW